MWIFWNISEYFGIYARIYFTLSSTTLLKIVPQCEYSGIFQSIWEYARIYFPLSSTILLSSFFPPMWIFWNISEYFGICKNIPLSSTTLLKIVSQCEYSGISQNNLDYARIFQNIYAHNILPCFLAEFFALCLSKQCIGFGLLQYTSLLVCARLLLKKYGLVHLF